MPERPASRPDDDVTPAAQETILVVEDDADVLEIALEMLRGLNYAVLVARDGPAALDVLRGPERVDLLFSDIVMPGGMDGAELAQQARAQRPGMPVLLASGYTARALSEEHGVVDDFPLLRKPYRLPDLARALQAALAKPKGQTSAEKHNAILPFSVSAHTATGMRRDVAASPSSIRTEQTAPGRSPGARTAPR
jgi:CheY-like chemotaxis protein